MKRIILRNVSKKFRYFEKNKGFLSRVLSIYNKEQKRERLVLDNISFDVDSSEILGIIGNNGSGKSTLLRIIAGIYDKDHGILRTNGKLISLINLNIGMNEKLTMEENIYLCCSLFGLKRREISLKLESIIDFAELMEYLNFPLYKFSNGMLQRLAFSIAVHCEPEILLLDEAFEVGDENFKSKCSSKIKELARAGASILLVSHNLGLIEKHCNKAIYLKNGTIKCSGKPDFVLKKYIRDKIR